MFFLPITRISVITDMFKEINVSSIFGQKKYTRSKRYIYID